MARNYTKTLLVSANVGSIFEDPEKMLQMWLAEFLATVRRLDPDFLGVHCQEVGGKNYEESMQHVNRFIKTLLASPEMQQYDKARVFLDEDFTAVDKFTALGNLYFIKQTIQNVQIYDFQEFKFVPVVGREVLSGNIENVPIKDKSKFPQEFFPDFKWSRKGYLRTRWNVQNCVFDLINIHLFHDASNITAMESTPSVYTNNRQRTLQYTLDRLEKDEHQSKPYFMFGDFNFRLDTHKLIKKLTTQMTEQKIKGKKNEVSKLTYTPASSNKPVLTVEKKCFEHCQHNEVFSNNNGQWLQEYDTEAHKFKDRLAEFEVTFPPSYPFSEDTEDGTSYMRTRCPSWCDRIMLSQSAKDLLYQDGSRSCQPDYNMMGLNICMGDHKPIYLSFKLRHNTGKDERKAEPGSDVCGDVKSAPKKPLLKKVISINGEEVDISQDLEDVNIHDYATFEREQHITPKFMSSIRRKSSDAGTPINKDKPLLKTPSFKLIARDVMRVENVLLALRHYSHRSDSETETDEEILEEEGGERGSTKRVSHIDITLDNNNEESLPSREQDSRRSKRSQKDQRVSQLSSASSPQDQSQKAKADSPEKDTEANHSKALKSPSVASSPGSLKTDEQEITSDGETKSPGTDSREQSPEKAAPNSQSPTSASASSTSGDGGADSSLLKTSVSKTAANKPHKNPPPRRLSQIRTNKESSGCANCCVLL